MANDESLNRVVDFKMECRPVLLALTMVCSELQTTWSLDGGQLTIQRSDPEGVRTRRMIASTLNSLVSWLPENRLANHARFALAELARADGQLSDAALISFRSARPPRLIGRLSIRAAYRRSDDLLPE